MHAILATFGTDGDVFPYLGLGRRLAEGGHKVSLAASDHYRGRAEEYGFEFTSIVGQEQIDRVLWNADFWHPLKAGRLAANWGLELIPEQYERLAELAREPGSVLIANPGVLAARLVQDKLGTPLVSLALQPWIVPSVDRPAILPGVPLPRRSPRWLRRLYVRVLHFFGDVLVGRRLNQFRRKLGLGRVRHLFDWWLSPRLILGFFPEWFAYRQRDWPGHVRTVGFPEFDGSAHPALSRELNDFLRAGDRPVAITFGTGIRHASALYAAAAEACRKLGRRGIILTKYPEQIPRHLDRSFLALEFAPFSKLLPECAAIIHHGGIGTTARALTARAPQVVVPVCFDQLDNGMRVADLGCGEVLALRKATPPRIAESLARTLRRNVDPPAGTPGACAFAAAEKLLEGEFPC